MTPTFALSTGSLYTYGIARVFELAAQAGFDAIEVLADHRWDSRQPAYIQRLSRETGLPVAAVHSPFIILDTPGWPSDPIGRLERSAALARELGAPVVVAHLPLRIRGISVAMLGSHGRSMLLPIPLTGERDYLDFLTNGLAQFEAEQGVQIGVENMPFRRIFGRSVNIHYLNNLEALAALPHLTLDTTHIGTWGQDLLEAYERLKPRVIHVHLSNFDGQEHQLPEDGHLPLGFLLRRLRQDGYRGAVTLEFNPETLQAKNEAQVLAHLRQAVHFCRQYSECSEDQDSARSAPSDC
jgi:sugar phosphate isomerase/epimerase